MSLENLYGKGKIRKPLKSYTPLKRKKGLNPISKNKERRAKRLVPEKIRKAVLERAGNQCEFVNEIGVRCTRPAERQPHHLLARSQGGKHTMDNLRACCWCHNMYAETHKAESIDLGWRRVK